MSDHVSLLEYAENRVQSRVRVPDVNHQGQVDSVRRFAREVQSLEIVIAGDILRQANLPPRITSRFCSIVRTASFGLVAKIEQLAIRIVVG